MKTRAKVCAARLGLAAIFLGWLIPLWFVSIPTTPHWEPYGHLHNAAEPILAILGYVAMVLIGGAAAVCLAIEVGLDVRHLWRISHRRQHPPWLKRWKEFNAEEETIRDKYGVVISTTSGYKGPFVTYDTPQPLVRGRLGSK